QSNSGMQFLLLSTTTVVLNIKQYCHDKRKHNTTGCSRRGCSRCDTGQLPDHRERQGVSGVRYRYHQGHFGTGNGLCPKQSRRGFAGNQIECWTSCQGKDCTTITKVILKEPKGSFFIMILWRKLLHSPLLPCFSLHAPVYWPIAYHEAKSSGLDRRGPTIDDRPYHHSRYWWDHSEVFIVLAVSK